MGFPILVRWHLYINKYWIRAQVVAIFSTDPHVECDHILDPWMTDPATWPIFISGNFVCESDWHWISFVYWLTQAIIWTNVGILLIGPLETNFSEILIKIYIFSFKKMHLEMSFGNWWPFCLGLNVLKYNHCHTICLVIIEVTDSCQNENTMSPVMNNSISPGQNGRHFADDIFRCIFVNEIFFLFWLKFNGILFLRVQLTISQHWFR